MIVMLLILCTLLFLCSCFLFAQNQRLNEEYEYLDLYTASLHRQIKDLDTQNSHLKKILGETSQAEIVAVREQDDMDEVLKELQL